MWTGRRADSSRGRSWFLWSRQSRSTGACEQGREGGPLLPLRSWQGQQELELVDPQDFPWKHGDSGWQWTMDGPDLPWLPEEDELEKQAEKSLRHGEIKVSGVKGTNGKAQVETSPVRCC